MRRTRALLTLAFAAPLLAACGGSPAALGITGPGASASSLPGTPAMADDALIAAPGTPTGFGADYAPSIGPTYGPDGRYYGSD